MKKYPKPPLTLENQIKLLISRGLVIADNNFAKQILSNISYYRLSNYFFNFWENKINHIFYKNTKLEEIVDAYNFDRELRGICFRAIETIEISLRTKLSLFLSPNYGAYWFCDKNISQDEESFRKIVDEINVISKQTKEHFIKEHFSKYDDQYLPSWKLLEITSFGLLSRMYGNIRNSVAEKKAIAKSLAIPNHLILASWLKAISNIRNICAHHSRLWDRTLSTPIKVPNKLNKSWISQKTIADIKNNKFYVALCCIKYLLDSAKPDNNFSSEIIGLIKKYPNIDLEKMNFPEGWQEDKFWRLFQEI